MAGVLLARGADENFPVSSLLAEAHAEFMDPKGAAMVIEVLNKMLGMKIDTTDLESEANQIQEKMRDIIDKAKIVHERYKETEGKDHSLGPMYG